jgi:hypothetical protein
MDHIAKVLDDKDVDWTVCEQTGLHIINSQDYNEQLLTDISTNTRTPHNSLDYGTFVVICPQEKAKHASKLMKDLGYSLSPKAEPITTQPKASGDLLNEVAEALDTEKLFQQFGKAMRVLGEQMGIGPLQDKLKERGITWRLDDEKDSLIFQVNNDVTGDPQPVARISKESLNSQHDFQEQLTNVLDFALGNSPGTFKQEQEKLRNRQQMVQDISRVVFPNDKSSQVASLMLS